MPAASLRALLTGAIDYAGLFPPANLALTPALENYAGYIRTADAWMLSAFILPVGEFDAAGRSLSSFDGKHPLRISALGPRTENAEAFLQSLCALKDTIEVFAKASGAAASIDQLEMPLPTDFNEELLQQMRSILAHSKLNAFWEAPARLATRAIELIAQSNATHPARKFAFKLRTGGVTAEAFPSSAAVAGALVTTAQHQVPIKFTAGLHHPIRLFHDSVQTKMHGFLNVLGAGVLATEHGWDEEQTTEMLDDESPASFSFTDEFFAWRDWKIATGRISELRSCVTSLGSCSFDEPREDLRALKLL